MKNIFLKACVPYIAAIAIFAAISTIYFMPEIFQNKSLYQHDMVTGISIGQEAGNFAKETGERSLWTNALFGGMPMYQIAPAYPSNKLLQRIMAVTNLYMPSPANLLFIFLTGAFLLFIALKVNVWMAVLGAIAYTFSSYFFVIIEAGHIWKVMTLAYIPPTFAGIIWAYRGKYWLGASITAIYLALQILSNHPQMTFYFAMMLLVYVAGQFIYSIKHKQLSRFFKATAVLIPAAAIAVLLNLTNLYHTYDYSKYSMRGGSELTDKTGDQTKGGLERSYVTSWSYGRGETFSLLIPNVKGGASGYMGADEKTAKKIVSLVQSNARIDNRVKNSIVQQVYNSNAYWADQSFTSGPVYAGAFVVFLFVLGLFIVQGWFKWVLLISTIMSIVLSWGSNFMWLTNLFLDYFPYYNKLRAVSSMLVIAELCIPILAMLALKEFVENPSILKKKIHIRIIKYDISALYLSIASTGGLVLLFILAPTVFFSFFSQQEVQMFDEAAKNPQMSVFVSQMIEIIESVRISIFRSDAWRSLIVIGLGVALILLYGRKKLNSKLFFTAVIVLTLADMWSVNKRYLSAKDFKPSKAQMTDVVPKTPVDEEILKDKDLDYRVYNLAVSPFNDGSTSFYHKSVGGYHGAKLRRYQDVIEHYLSRVSPQNVQALMGTKHFDALNMLNTKYIIVPSGQDNKPQLMRNPNALGNAWFVDEIKWVDNADNEIAALADINPAKTAVIDARFKTSELENFEYKVNLPIPATDSTEIINSSIKLTDYQPNKLIYETNSDTERLAVFSEIYYPKGWNITIDGKKAEMLCADYILRSMLIPKGKHSIEFRFDPESYKITESLSWTGYIFLLGFVVLSIFLELRQYKKRLADDL
jgi:hypothetical protein